jgi:hypothetical protein
MGFLDLSIWHDGVSNVAQSQDLQKINWITKGLNVSVKHLKKLLRVFEWHLISINIPPKRGTILHLDLCE